MSPGPYKCTERYATGWTDSRGLWGMYETDTKKYGEAFNFRGLPMMKKKVDDHKYTTEAKDLPIEACVSMWVIKYGDGVMPATETIGQERLIWEIGNRLWWANRLKYNENTDTYEIID